MANETELQNAIANLYEVFAVHARGSSSGFCGFCYTEEEMDYFVKTPLREIDPKHGATLLRETGDHWESASVYKHYLPRILELYAPPTLTDDLYPEHLSETLVGLGFYHWPESERLAVLRFLEHVKEFRAVGLDEEEWVQGFEKLSMDPERFRLGNA